MFSRATPVASTAGTSQQRAFATPMPAPVVVKAPVAPVVLPEAPAEPKPETAQDKLPQSESEPSFDLDDFELELADIALDMDLSKDDEPKAVAEAPPVVGHPALVEPAAQPFLQALAPASEPELRREEAPAPTVAQAPAVAEVENAVQQLCLFFSHGAGLGADAYEHAQLGLAEETGQVQPAIVRERAALGAREQEVVERRNAHG